MKDRVDKKRWIVVCNQNINYKKTEVTPLASLDGEKAKADYFPSSGKIYWQFKDENHEIEKDSIWKTGLIIDDKYSENSSYCKYAVDWNAVERIDFELIDLNKYNISEDDIIDNQINLSFEINLSKQVFFRNGSKVFGPFHTKEIENKSYSFYIPDYKEYIYYLYKWSDFKEYVIEVSYSLNYKNINRYFLINDQIPQQIKKKTRDGSNLGQLVKWYLETISELENVPDKIHNLLIKDNITKMRDKVKNTKIKDNSLQEHRFKRLEGISEEFKSFLDSRSEILDPLLLKQPFSKLLDERIEREINNRKEKIEAEISEEKQQLENLKKRNKNLEEKIKKINKDYTNKLNTLKEAKKHLLSEENRLIKDFFFYEKLINKQEMKLDKSKDKGLSTGKEELIKCKKNRKSFSSENEFLLKLEKAVENEMPKLKWQKIYEIHAMLKSSEITFVQGFKEEYCQKILKIYTEVANAEFFILPIETGWLGKESLFGRVDLAKQKFIAAEHGFLDFFSRAIKAEQEGSEKIFIALFLNSNYSLEKSYLQPLFNLAFNQISLDLFPDNYIKNNNNLNKLYWPDNLRLVCWRDKSHHRKSVFWHRMIPLMDLNVNDKEKIKLTELNKNKEIESNYSLSINSFNNWKTEIKEIIDSTIVQQLFIWLQEQKNLYLSKNDLEVLLNYISNIQKLFSSNQEIIDSLLLNWIFPLLLSNENNISINNVSKSLQEIGEFPRFQNRLKELKKDGG